MKFIGGLLLGLALGIGATLFFTSTQLGRDLARPIVEGAGRLMRAAPEAAGSALRSVSVEDLMSGAADAARFAESYAKAVTDDVALEDLASRLEAAAQEAGAQAGALAVRATQSALEAAATIPDLDALGDSLGGWQRQLAAYEMALKADDMDETDAAASEQQIAAVFAAPTAPAPPAPESAPSAAGFEPHNPLYKCPVIEVSNSGPVDGDRALVNYTPWVETPAGVLIRAPVESGCLSSGYGTRRVDGASRNHAGVDYYNREGGQIYAAGDGVVTHAGEDGA